MPTILDLTHPLNIHTPTWNPQDQFSLSIQHDYQGSTDTVSFRVQSLQTPAGIGTHIDAPAHCIKNGKTVDQLELNKLFAPCYVVNVEEKAHESYSVELEDIASYENNFGSITARSIVCIATGWSRFWYDANAYRNNYRFPSIGTEVAHYLVSRGIAGIAIDTLSPDTPANGFPVHNILLSNGCYIIENATNLGLLPAQGAQLIVAPLNAQGATEAPIRFFAYW